MKSFREYIEIVESGPRLGTSDADINELDYSSFTSSNELQHLRDAIDKNIVVSVAFVKKDGTVKHMGIKKNLSAYVPSTREKTDRQLNVEQNNDIKKVVDINAYIRKLKELRATGMEDAQAKAEAAKGAWRSVNLRNVLGFMVKGQFIDLRDENEIQQRFGDEIYNSVTPAMQTALAQSQQAMESIEEARSGADNFTADDIHELEKMNDIGLIKDRAIELIMTPSKKPMKPEKVSYFKNKIEMMKSKIDIIKLMYDLLLSGEGFGVVGSRNSMRSNSYRQRFGDSVEMESDELASLKELASQLDELSPKTLSSYAKKAVDPSSEKSAANLASRAASKLAADGDDDGDADDRKAYNRSKGVSRAVDRLTKESVESLEEFIKDSSYDSDKYHKDAEKYKIHPQHIKDLIQSHGTHKTAKAVQKLHDDGHISTDEAKKHIGYINSHRVSNNGVSNAYKIDDPRLKEEIDRLAKLAGL